MHGNGIREALKSAPRCWREGHVCSWRDFKRALISLEKPFRPARLNLVVLDLPGSRPSVPPRPSCSSPAMTVRLDMCYRLCILIGIVLIGVDAAAAWPAPERQREGHARWFVEGDAAAHRGMPVDLARSYVPVGPIREARTDSDTSRACWAAASPSLLQAGDREASRRMRAVPARAGVPLYELLSVYRL